jgi:hypothetical protein
MARDVCTLRKPADRRVEHCDGAECPGDRDPHPGAVLP